MGDIKTDSMPVFYSPKTCSKTTYFLNIVYKYRYRLGEPTIVGFLLRTKKQRAKVGTSSPDDSDSRPAHLIYKCAFLMGKSIFRCEQELPQTPNTAGLRNFRLHKELGALGETTIAWSASGLWELQSPCSQ